MITAKERALIKLLVKIKVFQLYVHMRCVRISARPRFRWILRLLLNRQIVDDYHHAPMCPANHWHRQALVIQRCNCGAERAANQPSS